ncbi:MAG: cytochrome c5 family protein [Betaproteobacteria bacterium]|nr:cytochrome c5 family protein [Betaproteobacteria bacterium]
MSSNKTRKQLMAVVMALIWALVLDIGTALAKEAERSGKDVVDAVCGNCHNSGKDGAPKIGNKQAWSQRTANGLGALTQHALKGIRKMPAHGGNPDVSDFEIQRAITHMVNLSGGNWTEPTNKKAKTADRSGKDIVNMQCIKCHKTGVNGAPKLGDRDAWIPRAVNGMDALVRSAINGHGGMPARGGMANLTDTEMREAVIYMFDQSIKGPH